MERAIYNSLLEWKRSTARKPLVLSGVRQSGKTYILKEFGRREFRRTHYINFEKSPHLAAIFDDDLSPRKIFERLSLNLDEDINLTEDLIIYDEAQNCPKAINSLKYVEEDEPRAAVCSAGSLIGLTVGEESFPVGKVNFMRMFPMTFREFLGAAKPKLAAAFDDMMEKGSIPPESHRALWCEMTRYHIVGGLPEAVSVYLSHDDLPSALKAARNAQTEILRGYQADFAKHSGKINAGHIVRVFDAVPLLLAKAIDGSVSRFRFKGVVPGRSKLSHLEGPIDWLIKAGLLVKSSLVEKPAIPLNAYASENLFKLYMFDVGMLCCMLDLPFESVLDQNYGSVKGYFAENLVAQELTAYDQKPLYWWRGRESEVEFMRVFAGKIIPLEVKSGACVKSRSLAAYNEKHSPPFMVRLSGLNIDTRSDFPRNYPLYAAGAASGKYY